jgi:hypothetical protein
MKNGDWADKRCQAERQPGPVDPVLHQPDWTFSADMAKARLVASPHTQGKGLIGQTSFFPASFDLLRRVQEFRIPF